MKPEPDEGLLEHVPAGERWRASPLNDSEAERARLRRRYVWSGYRPEPIPSYRGPVEPPQEGKTGICCSGGGIRSAAFNLGALQALQSAKVLQQARYLAAVSGGSYIAAAFAIMRKSSSDGTGDDSDAGLIASKDPFAPGTPEVQYLRNRCNYLAPDGMAKLYLGYRVVLGLIFNVVFIALPIAGATVVLGASVYQRAFPALVSPPAACKVGQGCTTIALPTWSWAAPAALALLSALLGWSMMLFRIRHDAWRRALATWATRLLLGALLLALLTVVLPELVALLRNYAIQHGTAEPAKTVAAPVGGGAVVALIAALSAHLRSLVSEAKGGASKYKALSVRLQRLFAYGVAAIVGPLLLYAVVVFSMWLTLTHADTVVHREHLVMIGVGALLLFAALYTMIDITALSLHHFYKRRLCSAFALRRVLPSPSGARAAAQRAKAEPLRAAADQQERLTGIAVERDYDELTLLSQTKITGSGWPTLLVCAAANISDPGATPPGRHVTSFTFSAHTVGGPLVGATTTECYEQVFENDRTRRRDLTLPAAVAMSGAAIAPSMGKMTRWPLTFLLAIGNVRLGVWVPNPRWVAAKASWIDRWRPPRPSYLLRELFGRNRADSRYLFVTDGGHYENLGLVELLRRGCTKIYCFDASGGESFAELGDAVALARSELGVEIEIDPTPLKPGSAAAATAKASTSTKTATSGATSTSSSDTPASGPPAVGSAPAAAGASSSQDASDAAGVPEESDAAAQDVVFGRFEYEDGTPGALVYARNVMSGGAPWDVRSRHIEDPTFPHDPTSDQLYTDQKFESYRALGALAGKRAIGQMRVAWRLRSTPTA